MGELSWQDTRFISFFVTLDCELSKRLSLDELTSSKAVKPPRAMNASKSRCNRWEESVLTSISDADEKFNKAFCKAIRRMFTAAF